MNPIAKIFIKLLTLVFLSIIFLQIYNFYCLNFKKCRPFFYNYYYTKKHKSKFKDVIVKTNLALINNNKFIDVITDYDEIRSEIGEITTVKFVFKNLTNNMVAVKSKMVFEKEFLKELMQIITCPCSSKIILKPNETKVVNMEFYYHILVDYEKFKKKFNEEYVTIKYIKEGDKMINLNNIKIIFE